MNPERGSEIRNETFTLRVTGKKTLSDKTVELDCARPEGFTFAPGQRVRFFHGDLTRDYSIASGPQEDRLSFCVRNVTGGAFSPMLAAAEPGSAFTASGPFGYFTFRPSNRPAVFVATGTGVAPFISMVRAGIKGFILLHGVSSAQDAYYGEAFQEAAGQYIRCISREESHFPEDAFQGRTTVYLLECLPVRDYDFYLCGRQEMIRDAMHLIDERFPGSYVYTEIFY